MDIDTTSKYYIPVSGDRIGDNVIIEKIAEGGMARIYKVKNEALEVTRVVKLMKPTSDIDADRFVTEARISANINHHNIVQCYNFGKFNDSVPYIEMEFVDGTNLYNLIYDHGLIPIPVTASIIYFVCKALHALHNCSYTLYNVERLGIVHRDIKPSNIIISKNGSVKLADFGIAKPIDLSIHTSSVEIVGSTFYLSPEQLKKDSLDFRTDIYSLGCVIYEMVTAQKTFNHNNISDIVVAKLNSCYSTELLHKYPEKIKKIITKCISPVKDDRFGKIEDVLIEIESVLKYYSIQDPQQIIYDYVKDPVKFYFPPPVDKKKTTFLGIIKFAIPLIAGAITAFYVITFLIKKESNLQKKVSDAPSTQIKPTADSYKSPTVISSDSVLSQTSNQLSKEPAVLPLVKHIKNEQKISMKNLLPTALSAFMKNDYNKCISLLSSKNNINDTLFLCYLGSLAETKKFSRLSSLITGKSINDGYYHYLKGRIEYNNGNYNAAIRHFLKALTIRSFYRKLPYYSNYYLAKSRLAVYLKTPNIVNRNIMLKSLERFTNHYCNNPNSTECSDIMALFEKHK